MLRTSISAVCLAVSMCLAFGSLGANAQLTAKIATGTPTPKGAKPPKGPADADLVITCQSSGAAGMEFLLATASGGKAPYTFVSPTPSGTVRSANNSVFVTVPLAEAGKTDTFAVTVTDKEGTPARVTENCPIKVISPPAPGDLYVGCPGPSFEGEAFLIGNVIGGTPPYTYSATFSSKQLVLDPNSGLVSGASTPGIIQDQSFTVTDKNGTQSKPVCTITVLPQPSRLNCAFFPVFPGTCVGSGVAKNANINAFWQTNGSFVFFNQINSIYSGASNSETVSAEIGTLNFPFGMQLNIGSNVQAGSTAPTAVSTGTTPTLSPSGAAQAAQNMLYGGTINVSGAYPVLAVGGNRINNPGSWGGMLDVAARQGIDIQSFKAGTSTSLSSPSAHTSMQLEGYFQVNSTNLPTVGGGTFAGALFVGGSYGYSYTSHQYIRDYGIAHVDNRLGQVSAGIVLNGVAKLAFSRAFGPSQTYLDGTVTPTPTVPTTVNNFKVLSFELSYQSPAPGSK